MEVKKLNKEEKIGQMLMIGIGKKQDIPNVLNMIEKFHIGGVIIYKNNYDTYEEMLSLINKIYDANKKNKVPIIIAIDQEGGLVNRMPNEFLNLYSTHKLSLKKDKKIIKESANITGKMLKETGINLNFSPVIDLAQNNNDWLSKRCFSKDYEIVNEYAKEYIEGMNDNKIISVVKHFPGHGASNIDSHKFLPVIKYKNLNNHLEPFKTAIKNSCDAIMLSHMFLKDIDKILPCSLSKKINNIIRKELKYDGVLITDDVRMKAVSLIYGKNKILKRALTSGNDIIMSKYKKNDEKLIRKLYKDIKDDNNLENHVKRILNLKKKYDLCDQKNVNGTNIKNINNKIKKINDKIDKI